jgi:hypothetical protein
MIKEFVELWEKNKSNLRESLAEKKCEDISYKTLVELIVTEILNDGRTELDYEDYDAKKMTVIDDGDYQGTQIFIIPRNIYQPSVDEYIYTHTYYGSCSGCDTLLGIVGYSDERPDEEQLNDLMTLCLHLLQRFKRMEEDD